MERFTNLETLVVCLTRTFDLLSPRAAGHHRKVARLSRAIVDAFDVPVEKKRSLVIAALLHDVGLLVSNGPGPLRVEQHNVAADYASLGAELLAGIPSSNEIPDMIRYHRTSWNQGIEQLAQDDWILTASQIIQLADDIAARPCRGSHVLGKMKPAKEYVLQQRGLRFEPDIADVFLEICDQEALWLDLMYDPPLHLATDNLALDTISFSLDKTFLATRTFSQVIDFRSPYTMSHSAGVAAAGTRLAELANLSEAECKMIGIAGNLHDIGKLAVPIRVLEKPGKLEPAEYDIIRSHAYHTYRILHGLEGFEEIARWAGLHHERLDGNGYPFGLSAQDIPLGSRILAVADVFSALIEDRPYRNGMNREEAIFNLEHMARDGALSPALCLLLIENFESVDEARRKATEEAQAAFLSWRQKGGIAIEA